MTYRGRSKGLTAYDVIGLVTITVIGSPMKKDSHVGLALHCLSRGTML